MNTRARPPVEAIRGSDHPHVQDEDNLREALRYSAAMLGELRTSYLSPQKYYELYMQVFDQLAHLEVGAAATGAGAWARDGDAAAQQHMSSL